MKPRALAFLLIPLVVALAPPLLAQESLSGPADCFREDFNKFLDDLAQVPNVDPSSVQAARDAYETATPEQRALIQARIEAIPEWRQLPQALASISAADVEFRRKELARVVEEAMRPPADRSQELSNVERMRRTMLFTIAQFRQLSPLVGGEYEAKVQKVAAQIETLAPSEIPRMYEIMQRLAKSLESTISGVEGSAEGLSEGPVEIHGICDSDLCVSLCADACDLYYSIVNLYNEIKNAIDGFLGVAFDAVGWLADQVIALPTTITNALGGLWDQIVAGLSSALETVVSLIPAGIEDLWGLLPAAVTGIEALVASINSAPSIPDLCPGPEVLAVVSDVCGRGAGELTELFVKLAPGDSVGLPFKIPIVLFDAGVQYLCMCADHAEAEAFDTAQAEHRTLTTTNLDQKLSLLATGASVDALNLSVAGLDDDVELVEAKVDTLGTDAADLKAALLEEETYLQGFRDLLTRVKIEENLLENPPNVVSTYQLPETYGGMLGGVRGIVWSTFAMMDGASETTNGALRELQRADALFNIGSFALAFEAYRSAYFEAVK